jgi:hypothetical protein
LRRPGHPATAPGKRREIRLIGAPAQQIRR